MQDPSAAMFSRVLQSACVTGTEYCWCMPDESVYCGSGRGAMKLPEHALRYGYYLACAGILELLHLSTLTPPTLISLVSPLGVFAGLLLVSKVVKVRQEWDGSHFTSIAKQQREHFFHEFFVYVFVALVSLIVSRELLGVPLDEALLDT